VPHPDLQMGTPQLPYLIAEEEMTGEADYVLVAADEGRDAEQARAA
jgi:hypothetical protein